MLIFTEGGKPEKNPRGKGEQQQESNPDHSGERRALTHYATLAYAITQIASLLALYSMLLYVSCILD
jgi:hypothetical protein